MKAQSTARLTFVTPRVLIGFALYAAGLFLALAPISSATAGDNAAAELNQSVPAQAPGRWRITGDLVTARYVHTATLLPNGQVLVAGGYGPACCTILESAELHNPATGAWTATGSMTTGRVDHTATLLPNGQVLVAGGCCDAASSAELYDPATGVWTTTGRMAAKRLLHTATSLPDGQVLVGGTFAGKAELYDPAAGLWTPTERFAPTRHSHTATLLPNGQVLVSGGFSLQFGALARAQLYKSAQEMLEIQ
jgi:hypothetical protein